jgi:hypothetical protein
LKKCAKRCSDDKNLLLRVKVKVKSKEAKWDRMDKTQRVRPEIFSTGHLPFQFGL